MPYVKLKKGQKYLELGCGVGHVTKHLASKYQLDVTGTDVDPEMIQLARQDIGDKENIKRF